MRTLHRWEDEILAFHTTGGVTNARTESANLGIKQIKRVGRGFRNFDNYRLRLLLSCGGVNWQNQPLHVYEGEPPSWWRRAPLGWGQYGAHSRIAKP